MFYNTKVEPLFDTASKKRGKNMFYNIFLDLNQKMRGEDSAQKRDGARVAKRRGAGCGGTGDGTGLRRRGGSTGGVSGRRGPDCRMGLDTQTQQCHYNGGGKRPFNLSQHYRASVLKLRRQFNASLTPLLRIGAVSELYRRCIGGVTEAERRKNGKKREK